MKINLKEIAYGLSITSIVLLGANIVYSSSLWQSAPTEANPSQNNVAAPVNVGSIAQIKEGSLGIGGNLAVINTALFSRVKIADGTQGMNKVLTSVDAEGNAVWAELPEVCQPAE